MSFRHSTVLRMHVLVNFLLLSGSSPGDNVQSDVSALVAKAYANRATNDDFLCSFRIVKGTSDWNKFDIDSVVGTGTGNWAKNSAKQLFWLEPEVFQIEPEGRHEGQGVFRVPFSGGEALVRDSEFELRLDTTLGSGNVTQSNRSGLVAEFSPFTLCHFLGDGERADPLHFLLAHLELQPPYSLSLIEGEKESVAVVDMESFVVEIGFDPAAGSMVRRCQMTFGNDIVEMRVKEVQRNPVGGLFPSRIEMLAGSNRDEPATATLWELTEIRYESPSEEELTFEVGGRVQMHRGDASRIIYLEEGERIGPDDLAGLHADMESGRRMHHSSVPASDGSLLRMFIATSVIVLCVVVAVRCRSYFYQN